MSEDVRKQLRTQGRYSDKLLSSDDKNKGRDRKQKVSPATKVSPESRVPKRNSNENRGTKNSFADESMSYKYEEKSDYKFSQLDDVKKAEIISGSGKHDLSVTENGTSTILFEPTFLNKNEGWDYFERLQNSTKWYSKNIVIQGTEYPQPRLVAWYGPFPYTYSGATLEAAEMPNVVVEIKQKVEDYLRAHNIHASFNSVLLNLYRNGKDSVAWHSDDELTMGISPTIASVSLGETRKFEMRQKMQYDEDKSPSEPTAKYVVNLTHGSLIIMTGCMQDDWQHRVPKEYHDKDPRINLTFRTVYPLDKIPEYVPAREIKKEISANYSSKTSYQNKLSLDPEDFPPLNSISSPVYPNAKHNVHEKSISNSKKGGNLNTSQECWDNELTEDCKDAEPLDLDKTAQNNNQYEQSKIEKKATSFTERHIKESTDIDKTATCKEQPLNAWLKSGAPISANFVKDNDCAYEEQPVNLRFKSDAPVSANSVQDENYIHEERPPSPGHKLDADLGTRKTVTSNMNQQNNLDKTTAPKSYLNVNAEVFIPFSNVPQYEFIGYDLGYLVSSYDQDSISKMEEEELIAFSNALKTQVKENHQEFNRFVREELDFLCELTDGTQSLKNQKLISWRICKQVSAFFERNSSQRSFERSSRQRPSYGNQSYHSDRGRKYSNHGRVHNHRYN